MLYLPISYKAKASSNYTKQPVNIGNMDIIFRLVAITVKLPNRISIFINGNNVKNQNVIS